ncbi:NAD(P)-binding domain-containing protein (plasmid) [Rhizobium sp. CB3171]|uniref:NAD(P)-binding domain-containing protein n=1 Tax=Rhizobium sp. CB3171 TaxID=3039157 RepID=UPI0024B196EA|nr:NAD(P)-binding domain-containing protein [Rhizobium sp. CB3171]WFU06753.1 NAD(P)-binding domain-containing protein [Rhizobium sp. CB3171]
MTTIGVIGTGDFSAYLIAALRRGGHTGRIILSPHNRIKAEDLSARYGCTVAVDQLSLIEEADWILLAVRPEQLASALPTLALRPGQTLISAVAGIAAAELRVATGGSIRVVRIMPSSYIEAIGDGLIPMFPACPEVEAVLAAAGKVLVLNHEDQLDLAMIGACLAGWTYRFIAELENWFVERGLEPNQARALVAGNIAGAAAYATVLQDVSLNAISDAIATPGTFTKTGLDHLARTNAAVPWVEALEIVHRDLPASRTGQSNIQMRSKETR